MALLFHLSLTCFALPTNIFGAFPPFESIWTYQIFSDLLIAAILCWVFLYREALQNERPLWKVYYCGLGTVCLGSIAILLYLLFEKGVFDAPESKSYGLFFVLCVNFVRIGI